jgi:hypothetical protein
MQMPAQNNCRTRQARETAEEISQRAGPSGPMMLGSPRTTNCAAKRTAQLSLLNLLPSRFAPPGSTKRCMA